MEEGKGETESRHEREEGKRRGVRQGMMTGVFSGRGNAGGAEIRSLGLGNERGPQQYSHGGKMG